MRNRGAISASKLGDDGNLTALSVACEYRLLNAESGNPYSELDGIRNRRSPADLQIIGRDAKAVK
jgi:hypothetical protein